ncbi:MAG: hypothetical protein NVS2B7_12230 [Herpetosiphon sp.]
MRLYRIRCHPYCVPFRENFATARGTLPVREGAILVLTDEGGISGVGEIAPLPSYGATVSDAIRLLQRWCDAVTAPSITDATSEFTCWCSAQGFDGHGVAALACAIDTAAADLQSRRASVSVAAWLADREISLPTVAVNATLGAGNGAALSSAAAHASAAGFNVVKLKVGVAASLAEERARIVAVRRAIGPQLELRLDANGAWDERTARALLGSIEPGMVQLVEQPVPPGDLAALARLRGAFAGILIAADEAAATPQAARAVVEQGAADVLVVKPVVVGGLSSALDIVKMASTAGLGVIVTSFLETGVGVAAAAHLAAAVTTSSLAHGLATSALLDSDLLVQSLDLQPPWLRLPSGVGLGVTVNPDLLNRYATAEEICLRWS